jgi:hypothetical protein
MLGKCRTRCAASPAVWLKISESNGMAFPRLPIRGSPFTFMANVVANSTDKMRTEEQEITIIFTVYVRILCHNVDSRDMDNPHPTYCNTMPSIMISYPANRSPCTKLLRWLDRSCLCPHACQCSESCSWERRCSWFRAFKRQTGALVAAGATEAFGAFGVWLGFGGRDWGTGSLRGER